MPYVIRKRGTRFAIMRKNRNGTQTKVGSSNTRTKAKASVRARMAAERKR